MEEAGGAGGQPRTAWEQRPRSLALRARARTAVTPVIMFLMCVVTVRRHAFCLRLPNHMSTVICTRRERVGGGRRGGA